MTITQLEYFLAVADHGSFSVAAERCFVTQPSLSVQISKLEDELGAKLFDRTRKPIVPTEVGRKVLDYARRAVASFYAPKEFVNTLRGEVSGTLRLGVIPSVSPYMMPLFVPRFTKRYPDVSLEIRDMSEAEIVDALGRDLIDVAILTRTGHKTGIRQTPLFDDTLYLYFSPAADRPLPRTVSIDDVEAHGLVTLSEGLYSHGSSFRPGREGEKSPVSFNFEGGSLETLINTVDATGGATIVPSIALSYMSEARRRRVVRFKGVDARRTIVMASSVTCIREAMLNAVKAVGLEIAADLSLSDRIIP